MAGGGDRRERLSGSVATAPDILASRGALPMPLVQVKLIEGVFSDAQKQEMIRKLTDTMVSIEGEALREVTWVVLEEVKSGSWGIGGKALTTADVKAMAGGG
jgi:4-oxalocrotonate tautomerase